MIFFCFRGRRCGSWLLYQEQGVLQRMWNSLVRGLTWEDVFLLVPVVQHIQPKTAAQLSDNVSHVTNSSVGCCYKLLLDMGSLASKCYKMSSSQPPNNSSSQKNRQQWYNYKTQPQQKWQQQITTDDEPMSESAWSVITNTTKYLGHQLRKKSLRMWSASMCLLLYIRSIKQTDRQTKKRCHEF
jgi:hypothetical protein